MKTKAFLALPLAAALLFPAALCAQTATNAASAELRALVQQVRTKIASGQTSATALAPELQQFEALRARHAGEQTDTMAQALYMEAQLYSEVLTNETKGDALMAQLKSDYSGTPFVQRLLKMETAQAAAKNIQAALKPGAVFPDFNVTGLDGRPLSVGALKGKVVLIDFWATWCGPCRGELPNVIADYKKFHPQGFDIIGVSLDSNKSALQDFLKKQDGMDWPQFFDGQGWQNELAQKYGVESIPFTVLVGRDGKIIGTGLRGGALGAAVEKALAGK